ncbi:MAG: STAS domain-containing protein [Paracoccaceae bacterium]
MKIAPDIINNTLILKILATRIDAASAVQFKDLMRSTTDGYSGRVVLDLELIEFIDSSGLGAIVSAYKALAPRNRMDICSTGEVVNTVFRLTRMDSIFAIYEDVEHALNEGELI